MTNKSKRLTKVLTMLLFIGLIFAVTKPISAEDGFPTDETTEEQTETSGYDVGTYIESANTSTQSSQTSNSLTDLVGDLNVEGSISSLSQSPLVQSIISIVSNIVAGILIAVVLFQVILTALDFCYIGVGFTRPYLNPTYQSQAQAGGMGMGGMGGMGRPQTQQKTSIQWVTDEAIKIVSEATPRAGVGGMGMAGMGAQQSTPSKNLYKTYLVARAKIFLFLMLAIVVLVLKATTIFDIGYQVGLLVVNVFEYIANLILG